MPNQAFARPWPWRGSESCGSVPILDVRSEEIKEIRAEATMIGGVFVFGNE